MAAAPSSQRQQLPQNLPFISGTSGTFQGDLLTLRRAYRLTPSESLVALALSSGRCGLLASASSRDLAKQLGLCRRTVQRSLDRLNLLGLVQTVNGLHNQPAAHHLLFLLGGDISEPVRGDILTPPTPVRGDICAPSGGDILPPPYKERARTLQLQPLSCEKEELKKESSGGGAEFAAIQAMIREVFGFRERDTHRVIERIQKAAAEAGVDLAGLRRFFEFKRDSKLDAGQSVWHARALCTFTESDLLPWATQKMRKPPTRAYQRTEPPREATPGEDERTEALLRETLAYERQILQRAAGGQR